jgi:primosomal protein N' (replication factor Y)
MKYKIAELVFPIPVPAPFDYLIPVELRGRISRGTRVIAPLSGKLELGFVLKLKHKTDIPEGELREIEEVVEEEPLLNPQLIELALEGARRYFGSPGVYLKAALPGILSRRSGPRVTLSDQGREKVISAEAEGIEGEILSRIGDKGISLRSLKQKFRRKNLDHYLAKLKRAGLIKHLYPITARRAPAKQGRTRETILRGKFEPVHPFMGTLKDSRPVLLLGKRQKRREKYLSIADGLISRGKGLLILLPEISSSFVELFRERFAGLTSLLTVRLTPKQYLDEWLRIKEGEKRIVIGARAALFSPIPDLGAIIVDEEADEAHYREETPRYNVRELALVRGKLEGVPVVLGAFFPSFESCFRAEQDEFAILRLPGKERPRIELIDMAAEFKKTGTRLLSDKLSEMISNCRGKTILILNRRGYAPFLMCRSCGFIPRCRNCSVSLTYHKEIGVLKCHYCGDEQRPPTTCPECGGRFIHYLGHGTEKLASKTEKVWEDRRVIRIDSDSVRKIGDIERLRDEITAAEIPLIVGTSLALREEFAEGSELIAFLNPDPALNQPNFRAGERLIQLIGKAACSANEVVIETYHPEHYVMKAASELNWEIFYEEEKRLRKALRYPPFSRLLTITMSGKKEDRLRKKANLLASCLKEKGGVNLTILGPAPAVLFRLKGKLRYQIILKGEEEKLRQAIISSLKKVRIPPADISIEVDPERIL